MNRRYDDKPLAARLIPLVTLLACALLALAATHANAQTPQITAKAMTSWVLPTTATDATPLTGAQALTGIKVYVDTSPIADAAMPLPAAELAGTATAFTWSGTVPNGGTVYVRTKACNLGGCSPFSEQASKQIAVALPGAPGAVSITVTFAVTP